MSYPYPGGGAPQYQGQGYPYGQTQPQTQGYPYGSGGQSWGQPQQQQQVPPGVDPQVHQWFSAVDADRSGKITGTELQAALVNGSGNHFSTEACNMMIAMFDRDQTGTIELMEFQNLFNFIQQWRQVFQRYDGNQTGKIELEELQRAITEMGYRLSPQFLGSVIAKFDHATRRSMTLDNFIMFNVQMRLLTDAFRARDTEMTGTIKISYEDFLSVAVLHKP